MPEKKCVICKTPKELSKFRKKFTNSDGRESVCIELFDKVLLPIVNSFRVSSIWWNSNADIFLLYPHLTHPPPGIVTGKQIGRAHV